MHRKIPPSFLLLFILIGTSCSNNSTDAQEFIAKYNDAHFESYPYPITHSDTLIVKHNFDGDFDAYLDFRLEHMKEFRDQYTWIRAGHHLLVGADKARQMAQELGFDHPYYFVQYLKCDTMNHPVKTRLIQGLKDRLSNHYNYTPPNIPDFTTKNLMGIALRYKIGHLKEESNKCNHKH